MLRTYTLRSSGLRRAFSTSARRADRAIVYSKNGEPPSVLRAVSYPPLDAPRSGTINVKYILSPINPADINVIEGLYPAKPSPDANLQSLTNESLFVGGNEGLAQVTSVGSGVDGLSEGDWVVPIAPQSGTWVTSRNLSPADVVSVPRADGLSEAAAAMLTVNPPTAYNMLHDFVNLKPGDWVVQNGANSAVGQLVAQIACKEGWRTINFVRNREDFGALEEEMKSLGADAVFTYDDLADKGLREKVKETTGGKPISLALNCVSGPVTSNMARYLGAKPPTKPHLVSYGAMSKQPLSLPTSLFIFKDLVSCGFWQSRWYKTHSKEEKEELIRKVATMGLKVPKHEIVEVGGEGASDEAVSKQLTEVVRRVVEGKTGGKKVLLKVA
ncbi:hypothetical protein BD626DRAFT_547280 [Schizophyllum amplum]|uniref:enoyl-[acyl-carrier-protein] reductase n=1 Tax=Schizophyllum amplum TaxID=97359 RepID=A0A550CJP0_9AGAR|nr:hypothetical protein BD626DRAFT_547280 [Auriculariopsis ampla]